MAENLPPQNRDEPFELGFFSSRRFFRLDCMASSSTGIRSLATGNKRRRTSPTTIEAMGDDIMSIIFAFLDIVHFIRCFAVCKSWCRVINKLKYPRLQNTIGIRTESSTVPNLSGFSDRSMSLQMERLAMERHGLSLRDGPLDVFQWKGHSVGFNKCRMKTGLILTGVGDKMMRLWSAESCKLQEQFVLPDKSPLIDFDFDEGKVVGLVGTRLCIWKRIGTRDLFSSRNGLFTRGLCMSYVDPQAVVGCEDGKIRVFDMYSRKVSQIIKMHPGLVHCLSFTDEQLLISGSSLGTISISDLSSDQLVTALDTNSSAGIKTLCFNPRSQFLFAGSSSGFASCWDLRKMRRVWETRVSPNMLYSMQYLRNDTSMLAVGGIDGVLRVIHQGNGEVLSRWNMEGNSSISTHSTTSIRVVEKKKAVKLSEDDRIDLMPNRPPITSLAVGMQKIVTTHGNRSISVWKFSCK